MITFIGMRTRTSGITRGIQMASRIRRAKFIEMGRFKRWAGNKVVMVIRHFQPALFRQLKKRGYIVGYDLLDTPVADHRAADAANEAFSFGRYASPDIDFYLVNNCHCRDELQRSVDQPVHIVPHATVNWENYRNPFREQVETIGYVGLPTQNHLTEQLEELCERRGLRFVNVHPPTREDCVEVFRTIDLGVIAMSCEHALSYKPNIKISNFQSFGIPTVSSPYVSFAECGADAWIRVDHITDFLSALTRLIDDTGLRRRLADDGHRIAQQFHIDRITETYVKIARDARVRR